MKKRLLALADEVENSRGSVALDATIFDLIGGFSWFDQALYLFSNREEALILHVGVIGYSPTSDIQHASRLCSWVLLTASDLGGDGLPMVMLGNPYTGRDVTGFGFGGGPNALACAWTAAALRALAEETEE